MKRIILVGIILSLLVVGGVGCDSSVLLPTPTPNPTPSSELTIIEYDDTYCSYTQCVEGRAQNTGQVTLIYAEVQVKWYNANSELLCTTIDNVNNLLPDEIWYFQAINWCGIPATQYSISVGDIW